MVQHSALVGNLTRMLVQLGLRPRVKDAQTLSEFLAAKERCEGRLAERRG